MVQTPSSSTQRCYGTAPHIQLSISFTFLFLLSSLQDHFCHQIILQNPIRVLLSVSPSPGSLQGCSEHPHWAQSLGSRGCAMGPGFRGLRGGGRAPPGS